MKKFFVLPALLLGLSLNAAENSYEATPSRPGEFVWNELATTNVQGAKEFYGKMFGWEFADTHLDNMTYTTIKKGNKAFGGIWEIPAPQKGQVPPHWLPYIEVEDINQAVEKARQNGATVLKPVEKVGDMGFFAVIKDPVGAHVALWQKAKK